MLLYPYDEPTIRGKLKSVPEDFVVDEELGFEPTGEGEHLFLLVEKKDLSTPELIDKIALDYGIQPRDIGYSGLKDKVALSRQWLSLHMPGQPKKVAQADGEHYRVLKQAWHNRKLRRGTHRANRFDVVLRDVDVVDEKTIAQIESLKSHGMANYFGQQRFGVQADNVARALRTFSNSRQTRKLSRNKRSLYLSALRSELFNQILTRRIEAGIWQQPLEGDVFMLAGSQSIFQAPVDAGIKQRYRSFDISSCISLFGQGDSKVSSEALTLERAVFNDNAQVTQCLIEQKAKLHMRALRVAVGELSYDYDPATSQLRIQARLERGSYFTSLLGHFVETG